MVKLRFYGRKVGKNVRVVKLEIIEHDGAWTVMHKLGTLVAKSRIVFICLNHEKRRVRQPRRNTKSSGHTTHQE